MATQESKKKTSGGRKQGTGKAVSKSAAKPKTPVARKQTVSKKPTSVRRKKSKKKGLGKEGILEVLKAIPLITFLLFCGWLLVNIIIAVWNR